MADLFISYAREQLGFVRSLRAELTSRGYEVWVDEEGIPPTVEWHQEIYSAIESSNAFIFVISPDSAKSRVCRMELDHAVRHNKRILPLVQTETDEEEIPESLRALNWIFFTEGQDSDSAFEKLVFAIETDWDWLKSHGYYYEKSLKWRRSGRRSQLLRGRDLPEAEQWLSRGAGKDPPPDDLLEEYIARSRKWARTRRMVLTASIVVVLVGLLVGLWVNRIQGQKTIVAELLRRAEPHRDHDLSYTTLLAAESLRRSLEIKWPSGFLAALVAGTAQEEEAKAILKKNLERFAEINKEWHFPGRLVASRMSSDKRFVAAFGKDEIWIWDELFGTKCEINRPSRVKDVAFHPQRSLLAIACDDTKSALVDLNDLEVVQELTHRSRPVALAFAPTLNPTLLAVATGNEVELWEETAGELTQVTILSQEGTITTLAFSPRGSMIAIAVQRGTEELGSAIVLQDWKRPELSPKTLPVGKRAYGLAFNAEGNLLAVGGLAGVQIWKTDEGTFQDLVVRPEIELKDLARSVRVATAGAVHDVAFDPGGARLATASSDGTARIWDAKSNEESTRMVLPGVARSVEFVDHDKVMTASWPPPTNPSDDSSVTIWKVVGPSRAMLDDSAELIRSACGLLGRNLTSEEWREVLGGEPYRPTCDRLLAPVDQEAKSSADSRTE